MDAELAGWFDNVMEKTHGLSFDNMEWFGRNLESIVARLVAEGRAELLAACKDILPHAEKDVERLNLLRCGNLYPAINIAKLQRADAAIRNAEAADRAARAAGG